MKRKKRIWIAGTSCLLLYALSIYFYWTREQTGNYTKMVSYEELYPSSSDGQSSGLKKWQGSGNHIDPAEIRKGKELTRLYAGVKETDPSFIKMLKIGSWIRRSYRHCRLDQPTARFSALSLTEQYWAASRAESPVWCGTFGEHFLFFCSINGITCRAIEKKSEGDYHIMNESFIPELSQWVFTDLTLDAVYCIDQKGKKIMNTIDLLYLNEQKDSSLVTVYGQEDRDSFSLGPRQTTRHWQRYLKKESVLNFYYQVDLQQVYSPKQRLIRYAFPVAWYETFSLRPVSNMQFYLRILSLYLAIVLTIIFILLYLKRND